MVLDDATIEEIKDAAKGIYDYGKIIVCVTECGAVDVVLETRKRIREPKRLKQKRGNKKS